MAFTSYLGVSGVRGDYNVPASAQMNGVLFSAWNPYEGGGGARPIRLTEITDGTSNTLLIGERPPSQDLVFGWWFAGAGDDGSGTGDVVLGAAEVGYAAQLWAVPTTMVGLQAGDVTNKFCDQVHFWSLHPWRGQLCVGRWFGPASSPITTT